MAAVLPSSSLPLLRYTPATQFISASNVVGFASPYRKEMKRTTFRVCGKPEQVEEGETNEDFFTDTLVSPFADDSEYLWKVAGGTLGGASAIKYGSIIFPEITRPSIIKGLLMISLPMLVAALILLKESFGGSKEEDLL